MATVLVVTERTEVGWKDCQYSAAIYTLVGNALTKPTSHNFGAGSGAPCDASVVIAGKTYLRVSTGGLAGQWFQSPPASLAPIAPPPPPPADPKVYTEKEAQAKIDAAVKSAVVSAVAATKTEDAALLESTNAALTAANIKIANCVRGANLIIEAAK
jgi:hypothetical protein